MINIAHILIVEDDKSINTLLRKNLELVGHRCDSVFDGEAALSILAEQSFDLILLDIMLPKLDGFEVLEKSQRAGTEESVSRKTAGASGCGASPPVIFLTARGAVQDRVKGLRLGADDYLVKPFDMMELQARVESVLRRTHKADTAFELGDVRVDLSARQVFRGGELIDFAPQEYLLIETLIKNRNIALSRDKLLEIAWGYDFGGDTRTVDVHIHSIRRKLGWENAIKTVFKLGYRLEVGR